MKTKLKDKKPWIKRGPLKTFSFFLGFSAVIWVVVQFSKEYTEVIEMPIIYTNLPKDKILVGDTPKTLDLRIRDRGFYIAWNRVFPQKITIDISDASEEGKSLVYDLELQKAAILSQLDLDYEKVVFLQKNIKINFEQRAVKKVAILSSIDLSFAVGYSALEEIKLQPDSIMVSGAATILDTLKTIKTKSLKINNISNDVKGKVKLETGNLKEVSLYQEEVNYSVRTEKFTEGKVEIPIKLLNVPEGTNVVIFPKDVVIYYQVSLKDFEKIDSSSFLVAVDFKNAKDSDGFLIAQILEEPTQVNNIRLNEKKIQFVIKR
ncbi:CdaR family protein [Gillisia hiemivivida]|uniref:YbbR-like domain-containing protein n=1 Tax=Gillisia hiemivivida TaxID=291190 RepID=A0A5C6ZUP3_9FLAO|nr:CdaR family protein [Gillisia hiemivivida]TXD94566.1 YbbR-like domain-containing protein [Gillisia hiemivivida]